MRFCFICSRVALWLSAGKARCPGRELLEPRSFGCQVVFLPAGMRKSKLGKA